jgi:hypothetical protein
MKTHDWAKKAKSLYEETKITDNGTFSDGWLQNKKKKHTAEGDTEIEYSSDCAAHA